MLPKHAAGQVVNSLAKVSLRVLNGLVILALVLPNVINPVSASSTTALALVESGQIEWRVQTRTDLKSDVGVVADTGTGPTALPTETAMPAVDATATPELTPTPQPVTGLALAVAAQPDSVQPGEVVTFTVTLQNTSDSPFTNITLADSLPSNYELNQSNLGELVFDSETRILAWSTAEILPEQTVTLTYQVTVAASTITNGPTYVVDSLIIAAVELAGPLKAETAVLVTPADVVMNNVNAEGGIATGLDGAVQIDVPAGAVDSPQAIVVEDLSAEIPASDGQAWTVFHVSLLAATANNLVAEQIVSEAVGENVGKGEGEKGSGEEPGDAAPIATEIAPEATATSELNTPTHEPETTATVEATVLPETTETLTEVAPSVTPVVVAEVLAAEAAQLVETETDNQLALQPVEAEFGKPVEMTISFDGLTDLATLDAGYEPYLVTLDEASGIWVVMPIEAIDREANTITAEVTHFSTWGAGVGPSFPQNGANVLLFDSASPDLFTGNAHFSIPIWTPPGRNGIQPSLALSYSSGTANGVLGDIQAPWVGMGWSIGSPEIARKITTKLCTACGTGGAFGYKDEYILLLNGAGYELIPDGTVPGRYHTREESYLYIQRHNVKLGNQQINGVDPTNEAWEWWEVVERNGTRWTLGTAPASEQIAPMAGYPGDNTGSWSSLGYAGKLVNRVPSRWRADKVVDVYGNLMTYTYEEETLTNATVTSETSSYYSVYGWGSAQVHADAPHCYPSNPNPGDECENSQVYTEMADCSGLGLVPCRHGYSYSLQPPSWHYTTVSYTITYDKASYLAQIDYTGNTQAGAPSGVANGAYSVVFEREARLTTEGDDKPLPAYNWNNWDNQRLQYIKVMYSGSSTPLRTYELNYEVKPYGPDDGKSWKTTVLTEVLTTGNGANAGPTYAPKVTFTYTDKDNRANCGSGCQEWKYPRLATVNNGWGGQATFSYQNDGRNQNSWYNWRVNNLSVSDGLPTPSVMKTDFSYSGACYKTPDVSTWTCTSGDQTELVGYSQTTVTTKDFDGTTTLGIAVHKFHTDQQKQGREYETQFQKPDGTVLAKNTTTYTVVTSGLPTNGYFTYASASESFALQDETLRRITRNEWGYDTATGNLLWSKEYDGLPTTPTLYRQNEYEYNTNLNDTVWILDRVWKQTVKDANGIILSEQRYAYDNTGVPAATSTTVGSSIEASATVTASSENSSLTAIKVIDGIIGQNNSGEWASVSQTNPWIRLTWATPQTVARVRLYDRVNTTDWAKGGILTFSDGSTVGIPAGSIPNNGTVYEITFPARTVTWVKFKVVGGSGSNVGLSEFQVFGGATTPTLTKGALTLTKSVQPTGTTGSGTTTLDSSLTYDAYGNLSESRSYLQTFTTSTVPSGSNYTAATVTYDSTFTYPLISESTAPGIPRTTTTTDYFFDLGLPKSITDINGGITSTAYDGLGRVVGITYPGYEQANVQYIYPTVAAGGTVTAPFGLQLKAWDDSEGANAYRSAWAIYDGLGRTLQVQGLDQTGANLIVSDTEYNAQGLVKRASLPRLVTGIGGAGLR
jgi:uncharacterized repeat protein (TIGR01451 family)